MAIAARWFDGLISQNVELTKEVYSLQSVDFDRQVSQTMSSIKKGDGYDLFTKVYTSSLIVDRNCVNLFGKYSWFMSRGKT